VFCIEPLMPKVLISDDERIIADTLALILAKDGFETRAAYSSKQAMELAAQFQPDMLISDVLMPDLNGVDAAMEVRKILPEVRVFLLSGQSATGEILARSKAQDSGFEVLVKPVHPKDLLARLRAAAAPLPDKNLN
jgi:DNA-binding response OmpR family regulator